VLSVINHGHNMGEDVLYSGTVSAAMEGLMLGVPALALSFAGGDLRADLSLLDEQVDTVRRLLEHFCDKERFPPSTLLNINLPPLRRGEVKGIRLTRLGRRVYSNSLTEMQDPWGRRIYWIGGGTIEWSGEPDSDFQAIRDGFISVTPLHIDLTNFNLIASADSWWRDL
jgi:5'-nucleotidase